MTKIFALVLLLTVFTGCAGSQSGSTSIGLSGTVVTGDIPVKAATVAITEHHGSSLSIQSSTANTKIDITDENGQFRFDSLSLGDYTFTVTREGFNSVSVTRRVDQQNRNVAIEMQNFLTVLHFSDSEIFNRYQMGAYLYPHDTTTVSGATIISPSGDSRLLQHNVHFGSERYSTWWNETTVEVGQWTLEISHGEGSTLVQTFSVDASQLPPRPTLDYPTNWTVIDTTTPTVQFDVSHLVSRAMIRIYEVKDRYGTSFDDRIDQGSMQVLQVDHIDAEHQVPAGVLEPGKEYGWQVYVVRAGDLPIKYDALSDMHYFEVLAH